MRRDTQAVLLLLFGGTLLKISFTGTYVRYVKPGQLPLLVIAGAVLIVVAAVTLWQVIRAPRSGLDEVPVDGSPSHAGPAHAGSAPGVHAAHGSHVVHGAHVMNAQPADRRYSNGGSGYGDSANGDSRYGDSRYGGSAYDDLGTGDAGHGDAGHGDAGHGHGEPRVGWLLLAPALALLLFAPPAIGSFQASRNGTALSSQAGSDFAPLPEGDPVQISVLDYASRAVFDQGRSIGDRRVELSGFVIAGPNGEPYLARMIVTCCAADARPIKVGLTGEVPTNIAPDQWIAVVGTYTDRADRDTVNGETIPYLQVTSSRLVSAPNQQYES